MNDAVPIVTGNFQPFRLILRDESDLWSPTIEQINANEYDYVKLHRLSTSFDVGIAPFSLGVCFDGTLFLPAIGENRDRASVLSTFNKTLTELLIGGLYCEAVTPDDIGYGSLSSTTYVKSLGGAIGPSAAFHFAAKTKYIGLLDVINLFEPETVTVKTMKECLSAGRELLSKLGDIPFEQVLYGTTFYVRKQWAESLIHIWTTTERIIEIAWQKYVVKVGDKPSKKRRAFLDDHRTWPISAKLEVLFQKSLIPETTLRTLDEVRKARNDFAHRGLVPTHKLATMALESCFELASLCSSEFSNPDLFNGVVSLVTKRCTPELYPEKTMSTKLNPTHFLSLPPLPGDKEWGDKPYEKVVKIVLTKLNEEV